MEQNIPIEYLVDAQEETIRDLQRRVSLLMAIVRKLKEELDEAKKASASKE